jgi:hypothetical protein
MWFLAGIKSAVPAHLEHADRKWELYSLYERELHRQVALSDNCVYEVNQSSYPEYHPHGRTTTRHPSWPGRIPMYTRTLWFRRGDTDKS